MNFQTSFLICSIAFRQHRSMCVCVRDNMAVAGWHLANMVFAASNVTEASEPCDSKDGEQP